MPGIYSYNLTLALDFISVFHITNDTKKNHLPSKMLSHLRKMAKRFMWKGFVFFASDMSWISSKWIRYDNRRKLQAVQNSRIDIVHFGVEHLSMCTFIFHVKYEMMLTAIWKVKQIEHKVRQQLMDAVMAPEHLITMWFIASGFSAIGNESKRHVWLALIGSCVRSQSGGLRLWRHICACIVWFRYDLFIR